MEARRRVQLAFRPHFEFKVPQNCTNFENVVESYQKIESYQSLVYVACAVVVILHVRHHSAVGSSFLFGLAASLGGLVFTPFLLIVVGLFTIYRKYATKALEKQPGFVGLMDGSDAYWAGEHDNASRSVINILLMLDGTKLNSTGQSPIDAVRGVMKRVIERQSNAKLTCTKKLSRYGYWYLEKSTIDLQENVRFIESNLKSKKDLEQFVSEVANEPLIRDTFWEILVAKDSLDGQYAVVIRVHHALGDGYALVKLFLDFMSDADGRVHKFVRKESVLQRLVAGYNRHVMHVVTSVVSKIIVYLYSSVVLAEQLLTPPDYNSLHNRIFLSGKKVCRTATIDLEKIKEVRRALGCRFTDVVLTALSNSLESCFVRWGENVDKIKTVIPARLPGASGANLANAFTVAMMEIPVTGKNKLELIKRMNERLKNLPDFYVNYWLLRVAFTLFPPSMLYRAVKSTQCTMAISNMPGPKSQIKMAGCDVTGIAFFLPNRDTTGVGISFLSYASQFNVGISIDTALLSCPDQANQILEGFVNSIDQMHRTHVIS